MCRLFAFPWVGEFLCVVEMPFWWRIEGVCGYCGPGENSGTYTFVFPTVSVILVEEWIFL